MESEVSQERITKVIDQISRLQRLELDTCARCGLCTDKCPAYAGSKVSNYSPSIRASKMLKIINKRNNVFSRLEGRQSISLKEIMDLADSVYNCTLCGRCMETCPFGFQTHELWVSLRNIVYSLGCTNANITRLQKQLTETRNPYGLDAETRLDWVDYTNLDNIPKKNKADVLYFVGCTTAFKGADQNVAFSIASILNHLNEDWTVLGEKEWCCGSPNLIAGDEESIKDYANHNIDAIKELGATRVITGCSGCYRMLKWEYPIIKKENLPFEVLHVVKYLRDKVFSGELKLTHLSEKIVYHDPCELARLGGIINAPREILASFADNFVELPENRLDSRCCGGGGLLQSTNNDLRLKVVKMRLDQIKESGARILTSSCPSCKLTYLDGVKEFGYDIEVLDLVELIAKQLK